jgi:ArsR family transcriptional regulator
MKTDYAFYIPLLKALSDETRLQIVDMLSCGPLCACDILTAFTITQPTLSYHMGLLTSCNLVNARRNGTWMTYSLEAETFLALQGFLKAISEDKEECLCTTLGSTNDMACKKEKGNE